MLLWLWRRVHRKYIFLSKLLLISCGVHGFLLFVSLFIYHPTDFTHTIDLTSASLHVVVLPFCKSVASQLTAAARTSSGLHQEIQHHAQLPLHKTNITTIETGSPKNKKLVQKIEKKKKEKDKLQQVVKEPVKPVLAKKEIVEPKKEIIVEPQAQAYTQSDVASNENIMYAGQQELDALELNAIIRSELEQVWQPPAGLSGGRCCKVSVIVDWDGNIKDMKVIESSQVLAFDMSVRNALLSMKFPKAACGKELILPFK